MRSGLYPGEADAPRTPSDWPKLGRPRKIRARTSGFNRLASLALFACVQSASYERPVRGPVAYPPHAVGFPMAVASICPGPTIGRS